jgi:hypothetical protein
VQTPGTGGPRAASRVKSTGGRQVRRPSIEGAGTAALKKKVGENLADALNDGTDD